MMATDSPDEKVSLGLSGLGGEEEMLGMFCVPWHDLGGGIF